MWIIDYAIRDDVAQCLGYEDFSAACDTIAAQFAFDDADEFYDAVLEDEARFEADMSDPEKVIWQIWHG